MAEVPSEVVRLDTLRNHANFFLEKHKRRVRKKLKEDAGPRPVLGEAPAAKVYTPEDKRGRCEGCALPPCDCCAGCAERGRSSRARPVGETQEGPGAPWRGMCKELGRRCKDWEAPLPPPPAQDGSSEASTANHEIQLKVVDDEFRQRPVMIYRMAVVDRGGTQHVL